MQKGIKTKNIFGVLCLFFAFFLFFIFFNTICFSSSVSAYSVSISTSNSVTLDTSPSGNGTSIKSESINVVSNCRAGYNLSIATPEGSDLYLNGDNTETASFTAVDGTSALSSSNNTNKWGYTLTSNPTSNTVFSPLSSTQSVLKTPAQTASPSSDINDTFNISYGVQTDDTVVPGTYQMANSGAIVYYLTMDETCMVVNIAYDGNNADAGTMGVAGTGVIHTGVKDGDEIGLIASNFSRTGYGFAGWSLDPNAGAKLIDNDNTNNPIVYGPQETVTLPNGFVDNDTDNDSIVKLYAVWIQSQGNLQGWTGCSNLDIATYDQNTGLLDLTKNSVTALTDQRDNDTYAVARLADGKCWMIEDLRLDNTNSDNSTGDLAQGYNSSFAGLADPESPSIFNHVSTAANTLYSTDGSTAKTISGANQAYRFPRYNNINTPANAADRPQYPTANNSINSTTKAGMYSYGNYYSWAAVIADTSNYTTNNQSVTNTSICPTGWYVPRGGRKANVSVNDFWILSRTVIGSDPANFANDYFYYTGAIEGANASNLMRSYPNNFIYGGSISYIVNPPYAGNGGGYWSSSTYSGTDAYGASISASGFYPATVNVKKDIGRPIRCVAFTPTDYSVSYNANGGSGAPASQTIYANGSATHTISGTTPTRSGYTFSGWMDKNGNEVQPGSTFITRDTNAVLYAIWTNDSCNPSATTIGTGNTSTDAVCLQDVKPSMKAGLPTATSTTGTYTLIDARDGQSYTVAKLADDNLWLTKNLNYGSSNDTLLTSYDTDLASNTTFVLPVADTTSYTATSNLAKVRLTNNSGTTTNGAYYSWAAAVANTSSISTNPTTSICPKNWDLPNDTQYTNLKNKSSYSSSNLTTAAPSTFLATGGFTNGATFYGATSYGHYWTSASSSSTVAYYAYLSTSVLTVSNSTGTNAARGGNKYYRKNIRCIASSGAGVIHYDANGGSGTMADQSGEINTMSTIKANSFTPANDHKQFREWCTNADGTGICVAPGALASSVGIDGRTVTLYAQWDNLYTLTFVNTALNSDNTSTKTIIAGQSDTVAPASTWTRASYKLVGWDTVTNNGSDTAGTVVYTDGQTITPTSDMIFYTVWRLTYTIVYDINTTDIDAEGTMNSYSNIAEGDRFSLPKSNFSHSGYGFAGWSIDSNAATNTSAKIYGPQETITAPAYPGSNTLTLYAIWVPSAGFLQNASTVASVCNGLTRAPADGTANISSVSALTDQRDNDTYAIAKLADGECWMIENLRLDSDAEHNSDSLLAQGYGSSTTYGNFAGLAEPESSNFNNSTTANSLYYSGTQSGTATTNIGTSNSPAYRMPRYNNSPASYSSGNYYTWAAAMANTSYYNTVTEDSNGYTQSEAANTSICPLGWKLPYGRDTGKGATPGGFSYLDVALGGRGATTSVGSNPEGEAMSNKWSSYPNNFIFSGYYGGSAINNSYGYYWTSTAYDPNYSYFLTVGFTSLSPGTARSLGKNDGMNIRCVADKSAVSTNTVQYNPNGSDVVGTMGSQTISAADVPLTLLASNFSRTGYGFAGWSADSNAGIKLMDNDNTNNPVVYGPNETISNMTDFLNNDANNDGIVELYAVWIPSQGNLQGWTGCANLDAATYDNTTGALDLTKNSITALTDQRDSNTYTVARLADGNCWMIENLRLENTGIDNANGSLAQGYNSNFIGLANSESPWLGVTTTANSLYTTETGVAGKITISGDNQAERFPRYNHENTNARASNPTNNSRAIYSYGNYYTWSAAVADTTTYSGNNQSIENTSICPTGWRLPKGGDRDNLNINEFWKLSRATIGADPVNFSNNSSFFYSGAPEGIDASNKLRNYPNNFVYSGRVTGNAINNRGSYGNYWSSTTRLSYYSYSFDLYSFYINPGTYYSSRYYGKSIRCIISL